MSSRNYFCGAVSAALAVAALSSSFGVYAAHEGEEQCAGIVKAGKNDCATAKNACHGHVSVSGDPEAWIYLPKGTCERIADGRVVQVVDPTPVDK